MCCNANNDPIYKNSCYVLMMLSLHSYMISKFIPIMHHEQGLFCFKKKENKETGTACSPGKSFVIAHQQMAVPTHKYWTRLKARIMTEQTLENLQKEMDEIKGLLAGFDEIKEQMKLLVRLMADKKKVREDEDQKVDSGVPLIGPTDEGHSERKVVVIDNELREN